MVHGFQPVTGTVPGAMGLFGAVGTGAVDAAVVGVGEVADAGVVGVGEVAPGATGDVVTDVGPTPGAVGLVTGVGVVTGEVVVTGGVVVAGEVVVTGGVVVTGEVVVTGGGVTAAPQFGAVMVSLVVVTVPPNPKALPVQLTVLPMVIPEASMSVPRKVDGDPSVVAAVGVHQTSHADAPLANLTAELATDVRAPFTRKMYVPLPVRVMPAVPMEAALEDAVQ